MPSLAGTNDRAPAILHTSIMSAESRQELIRNAVAFLSDPKVVQIARVLDSAYRFLVTGLSGVPTDPVSRGQRTDTG